MVLTFTISPVSTIQACFWCELAFSFKMIIVTPSSTLSIECFHPTTEHKEFCAFQDTLIGMPQNMSVPGLNGYDIYNGLQDLNNTSAPMDQPIFDLSGLPIVDDYAFYSTFMQDSSDYIELDDLEKPLNCPTETFGIDQFYDVAGSCNHNVPQFSFNGTNQPAPCTDQPPMVSNQSNIGNSGLDVGQVRTLSPFSRS